MKLVSSERVKGIEPSWPAWKAGALPLSYTRETVIVLGRRGVPRQRSGEASCGVRAASNEARKKRSHGEAESQVRHVACTPNARCPPAAALRGTTSSSYQTNAHAHRRKPGGLGDPSPRQYEQCLGARTRSMSARLPVGLVGIEPTTSCSQSRRAAKLRHSPFLIAAVYATRDHPPSGLDLSRQSCRPQPIPRDQVRTVAEPWCGRLGRTWQAPTLTPDIGRPGQMQESAASPAAQ